MEKQKNKTHWLQTPNKNYLGHWDLPNGNDMVVTIRSAKWEEVKNPIINRTEAKRVVRFEEKGIKPFICNETNAQSIIVSTGTKYMEDCQGYKIKLYQSQTNVKGEKVDCLRVRELPQSELNDKLVTNSQRDELQDLISKTDRTVEEICSIMRINSLSEVPAKKFHNMKERLLELGGSNAGN